jgi:hypothetical protein
MEVPAAWRRAGKRKKKKPEGDEKPEGGDA